jgi:hypothetical protein
VAHPESQNFALNSSSENQRTRNTAYFNICSNKPYCDPGDRVIQYFWNAVINFSVIDFRERLFKLVTEGA